VQRDYIAPPASKRCTKIVPILQSRPFRPQLPFHHCKPSGTRNPPFPPLAFPVSSPRAMSHAIANISRPSPPRLDRRSRTGAMIGQSCLSPIHPIPHPLPLATISAELSLRELSLFTRAAWRDILVSSLPCESAPYSVPCRRFSCSAQALGFLLPQVRTAEVATSEVRRLCLPAIAHVCPSHFIPSFLTDGVSCSILQDAQKLQQSNLSQPRR
jgi:hypothetical protein